MHRRLPGAQAQRCGRSAARSAAPEHLRGAVTAAGFRNVSDPPATLQARALLTMAILTTTVQARRRATCASPVTASVSAPSRAGSCASASPRSSCRLTRRSCRRRAAPAAPAAPIAPTAPTAPPAPASPPPNPPLNSDPNPNSGPNSRPNSQPSHPLPNLCPYPGAAH